MKNVGERKKPRPASDVFLEDGDPSLTGDEEDDLGVVSHLPADAEQDPQASRFDVRKLMTGGINVDHLKDLKNAAKMLDELRRSQNDQQELLDLTELKLNVSVLAG